MDEVQGGQDVKRAAQALAARRRRTQKGCARCGREMTGIATQRYCSAACRTAAAKQRDPETKSTALEGTIDNPKLTPDSLERLREFRKRTFGGRIFDDSTVIVREEREKRSAHWRSFFE